MTDKFTLRDFFVFFLSGLAVFFCVLLTSINETIDAIKWLDLEKNAVIKAFLKDYSTLIGLLTIPLFYFIGQIVHGVDDMFYSSVKGIRSLFKISPKSRFRININDIFDCNRINGILERNNVEIEKFWYKFARLQRENIFLTSDYWALHD